MTRTQYLLRNAHIVGPYVIKGWARSKALRWIGMFSAPGFIILTGPVMLMAEHRYLVPEYSPIITMACGMLSFVLTIRLIDQGHLP